MTSIQEELKEILHNHESFFETVVKAVMKADVEIIISADVNPESVSSCMLGKWINKLELEQDLEETTITKRLKAEHHMFHDIAYNISEHMGDEKNYQNLKDFEQSRDRLSILIYDLMYYLGHLESENQNTEQDAEQFAGCSLSEQFEQDDLDLVFLSLGSEERRSKLISDISKMEYERAINLLTLVICLLSKMDRGLEDVDKDYDRVTVLRNTLVDIEMNFIEAQAKKEMVNIRTSQTKIERQLTPEQEEDMYSSWLARMED